MVKRFTVEKKAEINRILLKKGREYFIRYGLKKTSVDEIAIAAGIAKGSFYKFFESKEALFLAIHEESEKLLQQDLILKLDSIKDPEEKLRAFFRSSFTLLEQDPLLRLAFCQEGFDSMARFLSSQKYEMHFHNDMEFLEKLVQRWIETGIVRRLDLKTVSATIASIFYIVFQREQLGNERYLNVTAMLGDSLASYLAAGR
jgi:AcrR family transcriptional regulator